MEQAGSEQTPALSGDGAAGSAPDLAHALDRVATPLREQVLRLLEQEILELRLRPGQRLLERELVERFGVSRTTIREALGQLAARGLVTNVPQKGAIVSTPSPKEAAEIYEVRAELEGLIARQFAERATDDQVRQLREAFEAMEESYRKSRDPMELLRSKRALYNVLLDGADNGTVREILESFQARIALMRATTLQAPDRPKKAVEEMRTLVEAIERRDAEAAKQASITHVRNAAQTLFEMARDEGDAPVGAGS
ncbi:MAG TPA: GntR family transcriptional regulator [Solirubrobacterales bacterium]